MPTISATAAAVATIVSTTDRERRGFGSVTTDAIGGSSHARASTDTDSA